MIKEFQIILYCVSQSVSPNHNQKIDCEIDAGQFKVNRLLTIFTKNYKISVLFKNKTEEY